MNPRIVLLSSVLVSGSFFSSAQSFPAIQGETAAGKEVVLVASTDHAFTIIGLAYSEKAKPLLEDWYEPAYLRFVAKHGLFASSYDCQVYFAPLFTGLNKAAYGPSINKFKKGAAPEVVDHVIFCKVDIDELKTTLGLNERDIPYFFVLDRTGKVVHRTQGAFTEEKLEALEEVLLR